ncbi:MAG: helix-turn-helix domain-containing protein [Sporomusaceae bacterium]|nr:helix-turn-helix domain-containing protein [Sporomusaceae bacterium]
MVEAETAANAKEIIMGEDPNALIGVIAPIGIVEIDHQSNFMNAMAELAEAANNFSLAVNKLLQTWTTMGDVPNELSKLLEQFRGWYNEQGKPKEQLSDKLGVQWDQLPLTLNVKEVAAVMRISTSQVYQFCKGSMYDFPYFQVGSRYLVPRDKLKEWMEKSYKVEKDDEVRPLPKRRR